MTGKACIKSMSCVGTWLAGVFFFFLRGWGKGGRGGEKSSRHDLKTSVVNGRLKRGYELNAKKTGCMVITKKRQIPTSNKHIS